MLFYKLLSPGNPHLPTLAVISGSNLSSGAPSLIEQHFGMNQPLPSLSDVAILDRTRPRRGAALAGEGAWGELPVSLCSPVCSGIRAVTVRLSNFRKHGGVSQLLCSILTNRTSVPVCPSLARHPPPAIYGFSTECSKLDIAQVPMMRAPPALSIKEKGMIFWIPHAFFSHFPKEMRDNTVFICWYLHLLKLLLVSPRPCFNG